MRNVIEKSNTLGGCKGKRADWLRNYVLIMAGKYSVLIFFQWSTADWTIVLRPEIVLGLDQFFAQCLFELFEKAQDYNAESLVVWLSI
ncbi:hypothetical protein [Paenibacillus silagei]|uniref:Uncharacterized protein n=1 Tax=Paenibacillus silagei TaxID=1670801 RepID=A0ABS4NZD2_9BACL|nr:hypothetical protein [Paenibacillus silagei]MBP2114612.1 hypothetical protein [Paenibacillus silagei]